MTSISIFKLSACAGLLVMIFTLHGLAQTPRGGKMQTAQGEEQDLFSYRSSLDSIHRDAWYRVIITPSIAAKSKADLTDLRIRDRSNGPVPHILKTDTSLSKYMEIPAPVLTRKDSGNHHSYLTLSWAEPFLIDRLWLDVTGPALYKRRVEVYAPNHSYFQGSNTIDPSSHGIMIPALKTSVLVVDISNGDNAPLVIPSVRAEQRERYLLAWLPAGSGYSLLAGNERAEAPEYDLKYFADTARQQPIDILPGALHASGDKPATIANSAAGATTEHSGVILWSIIGAVLLLLLVLSWRLTKAISGKEK